MPRGRSSRPSRSRSAVALLGPRRKTTASQVSGRILIVEDNPENIPHLVDFLQFKGLEVSVAFNGQEGLDMTRETRPDLVLMDIQMPGITGLEAIAQIRDDPTLNGVTIVAVTALASEEDRRECLAAGADSYVSKPFRLVQLFETIEGLLQSRT